MPGANRKSLENTSQFLTAKQQTKRKENAGKHSRSSTELETTHSNQSKMDEFSDFISTDTGPEFITNQQMALLSQADIDAYIERQCNIHGEHWVAHKLDLIKLASFRRLQLHCRRRQTFTNCPICFNTDLKNQLLEHLYSMINNTETIIENVLLKKEFIYVHEKYKHQTA